MLIVASLLIYLQFIQPAYNEAQSLKAQKNGLQTFIDSEKTLVKQVESLVNSYEGQGQIQQAVSDVLPASPDIAGATAQLYGLAQANGLSVRSFTITVSKKPTKKNAAPVDASGVPQPATFAASLQKPVSTVTFEALVGGSYENFKSFLSALETNVRIFDVKKISLQQTSMAGSGGKTSSAAQDFFDYNVTVTTYYQNK